MIPGSIPSQMHHRPRRPSRRRTGGTFPFQNTEIAGRSQDHPNPTMETLMFRTLSTAAILALTAATAQAGEPLDSRVHEAAVAACAVESADSLPASHYAAITRRCVERLSNTALAKIKTEAEAKTHASTAALNND